MVERTISRNGRVNISSFCRQFGADRKSYYRWKNAKKKKEEEARENQDKALWRKQIIGKIISRFGYIPGYRTIRQEMKYRYGDKIANKTVLKLMREMGIISSRNYRALRKIKDPYKGQALHEHPACALSNEVDQWFVREKPRQIILTDITYLFYGLNNDVCYLATFKDGFTREILGYAVSRRMDVSLIQKAYDQMMKRHRQEFPGNEKVLIHSDQGSQYLSTTYQKLLWDNDFVQSMSRRGNSQDNASMESFYAILKSEANVIERAKTFETVCQLVDGYIRHYNTERPQDCLGWLSPQNYYAYKMTGIFPLDSYFNVDEKTLLSMKELLDKKEEERKQKNAQRRAARKERLREPDIATAAGRIESDLQQVQRGIRYLLNRFDPIHKRLSSLEDLEKEVRAALEFVKQLDPKSQKELLYFENWRKYPELKYVQSIAGLLDMDGVFPQTIMRFAV